jgi:hypothetical protein
MLACVQEMNNLVVLLLVVPLQCSSNFLSVKGPELINMYVGESERQVRPGVTSRPCWWVYTVPLDCRSAITAHVLLLLLGAPDMACHCVTVWTVRTVNGHLLSCCCWCQLHKLS